MTRLPDWEARLNAYLAPLRETPFEWGKHDCCLFAAGAVEAMTGVDPMPEFRGRYSTARGSAIALGRRGKGTLAATIDAKLEPVTPAFAHRGDIVMIDGGLGIAMGSVAILVGRDQPGLLRRDRRDWSHAWRVPMPHGSRT